MAAGADDAWFGTATALWHWDGESLVEVGVPRDVLEGRAMRGLGARKGELWVVASEGRVLRYAADTWTVHDTPGATRLHGVTFDGGGVRVYGRDAILRFQSR